MSGTNETRVVDPETGGAKGRKDERFDLFPFDALEEVALVYGFGAKKYDDNNWLKGYAWRLSLGALLRHIARWACGEDNDQETGLSHMAHAAWHCLTLITFSKRRLGKDDRAPSFVNHPAMPKVDNVIFNSGDRVIIQSPLSTCHLMVGCVAGYLGSKPVVLLDGAQSSKTFEAHEVAPYKPSGAV